jgi:tRNA nucleotidyltransferase (CCA-adding enzyme)
MDNIRRKEYPMNVTINKIFIPVSVREIMRELVEHGYEAFVVGGCVRDSILGIAPHDWDIATNAHPDKVRNIFNSAKVIVTETSLAHGTVTVRIGGENFEITTFRNDVNCDGRHAEVAFAETIEEDLSRRDFTFNAMAFNDVRGLIDPFGGVNDLMGGIVRCVGNPDERFTEDYLRMFRAVRFAARFCFAIDLYTFNAMERNAEGAKNLSRERVWSELWQILNSPNPMYVNYLFDSNVMKAVHPALVYGEFTMCDPIENLCRMFITNSYGVRRFDTEEILRFLTAPNDVIDRVMGAFRAYEGAKFIPDECTMRHNIYRFGEDAMNIAIRLAEGFDRNNMRMVFVRVVESGNPMRLSELAVKGNDMMEIGFTGKGIGEALRSCMTVVLDNPERNNREFLMFHAKMLFHNHLIPS